jgi:hypothetical protein
MRRFVITCVLLAVASIANASPTFTWIFSSNGSNTSLGNTSVFSNNGISITASGYASNNGTTPNEALYSKNGSGNEIGLGLVNDPSSQDEIYFGTDFIQLDLTNVLAANIRNLQIAMNSSTNGEAWAVYNTASAPTLNSILPTQRYLDIVVTAPSNGNVLLYELTGTSSSPEPGSWVLVLSGLGLAIARWTKSRWQH